MTDKERYCMGRAEYLAEYEGYSLSEAYKIAEKELYATMSTVIKQHKESRSIRRNRRFIRISI